ncbi:MAG: fatty acid desaturase [Pseudomonadota bacterium]
MPRPSCKIARCDLDRLRQFRLLPNLTKIPLFTALMVGLGFIAWHADSLLVLSVAYIGIGYMWMGMVTFMHDALHYTLFRGRWANWLFGVLCMLPIFATFVGFREDHIEHHRHNRSPRDPDAFTMGKRGMLDYLQFYAYALAGGALSFIYFNFIYPVKSFGPRLWAIQVFELSLKVLVYWLVLGWAAQHGMLDRALGLLLWPVLVLALLNSMRFIAEHYGTPWNAGQMAGTRTVVSNRVNAFFWNNINWHIGHHVYPSVPWYNLVELHKVLEPQIVASGAPVDRSYVAVYLDALRRGPESPVQLELVLAERSARRERFAMARATV